MYDARHTRPATFDQFFQEWQPRAKGLAYRMGMAGDDIEEAVSYSFAEFVRQGTLEKYDPQHGTFSNYIYGLLRVRYHLYWDRVKRPKQELTMSGVNHVGDEDEQAFEDTVKDPAVDIVESFEYVVSTDELNRTLAAIYNALKSLPVTKTRNMAKLFADIIVQVQEDGEVNYSKLAVMRGYSRQAMMRQVEDLLGTEQLVGLRQTLRNRIKE